MLGLEAITGLIPINFHFQKLSGRLQFRAHSLPSNHILWSLMEPKAYTLCKPHSLSLGFLLKCQCKLIKGPVVDMDNCFNKLFLFFDFLNPEFMPECRIINTLSSHFSFYLFIKYNEDNLKSRVQQLDHIAIESSSNPSHAFIIIDASIKNNIVTSISHVHIHSKPLTKTLYHTVNVMSTEAELFAIRYGINQATNFAGISKIIVITNSIHAVRKIFDLSSHLFWSHAAIILKELWILSHIIRRTWLNSGNVLADATGLSTKWLTKRLNCSTLSHFSLANLYGILARRMNVTFLLIGGKWLFKCWI